MVSTHKIPGVAIEDFKRTKIIATTGPSADSYDLVKSLIANGANGIRLNFSHGDHAEHLRRIKWIRKASTELSKPVAIIQDLQGPKIRLGDFEGIINVKAGQSLQLAYGIEYAPDGPVPVQYNIAKKVKRGERLYIYDGKVRTTVTSVRDKVVHVRVENDGILIKRKGINLPDTDFQGDILTKKDRQDIAFGVDNDIDFVALSFVQHPSDIRSLRNLLNTHNSQAKIIAKIETNAAIQNLESIVQESDAVMIARGDLAIETSAESVPVVQRKIIGLGLRYAKPTIVATQMLASMSEFPEPTRAEVSDVATAAIVGADATMLSDETAAGKYPVEAVRTMKKVIMYAQANAPLQVSFPHFDDKTRQNAISQAIISIADNIGARAIVAETKSGATARNISSRRATRAVIAVTPDIRVAQQLAIVYGVQSYVRPDDPKAATKLTNWLQKNKVFKKHDVVVSASGQYPGVVGTTDTIKVRVIT